MSITDKFNKIKDKLGIDNFTIMYLIVIIGVGISAFGLGRLSTRSISSDENYQIVGTSNNQLGSALKNDQSFGQNFSTEVINQGEKKYVASKNGKLYYPLDCSGAKRIKSGNELWFATASEAEKSGYQLSKTCQ
jgi:hypothetical protein